MVYVLASDYVTSARRLTQDKLAPYRYPDSDYVDALGLAVGLINEVRPDVFILVDPPIMNVATDACPLPSRYAHAVVEYVAGRVMMQDTESGDATAGSAMMGHLVASLKTNG